MMGESGIVRIDALVGFMALSPMIMNSGFSFILCVKIRSGGQSQTSQACFRTRGSLGKPEPARYVSTSASTRQGLPEPRRIFKGGVIRIAPVGGSWSRFTRLASP